MFGMNRKLGLKIAQKIGRGSASIYVESKKHFELVMKDSFTQDDYKIIRKHGLRIVEVEKVNGGTSIILKRESLLPRIVIVVLTFEVLMFSLIIFTLLIKTGLQ